MWYSFITAGSSLISPLKVLELASLKTMFQMCASANFKCYANIQYAPMVEIWCWNRLCHNPEIFKRHVLKSHLAATIRTPFYLIETLHSAAGHLYMLSNNPHFCASWVCEKSSKHLWVNRSTKRLTNYRDVAAHFTIVVQSDSMREYTLLRCFILVACRLICIFLGRRRWSLISGVAPQF